MERALVDEIRRLRVPRPQSPPPGRRDVALALACGLAAMMLAAAIQRARSLPPAIDDEFAYLFQAKTFALLRLSNPAPPLPEFFEASHRLVTPFHVAKYFPLPGLVFAPFVRLGVAWLGPCVLFGTSAALLVLALRSARFPRVVAAGAAVLFIASGPTLRYFTRFLSQPASVTATIGAMLAAALFVARPGAWPALSYFACASAAALARPITGAALAVAGAVLLWRTKPGPRVLAAAAIPVGMAALFALVYFRATTGSPFTSPWSLYARQYFPFDGLGIGPPEAPAPTLPLPPQFGPMRAYLFGLRSQYVLSALPGEALYRAFVTVPRFLPAAALGPLLLLGLLLAPAALRFAGCFAAALYVLQLGYFFHWAPYLLELSPWVCALTAWGAYCAVDLVRQVDPAPRSRALLRVAGAAVAVLTLCAIPGEVRDAVVLDASPARAFARFEEAIAPAARERGLVFVRAWRSESIGLELIQNEPDLETAPVVFAVDRGERNAELRALFPARPAFLYDPQSATLARLP